MALASRLAERLAAKRIPASLRVRTPRRRRSAGSRRRSPELRPGSDARSRMPSPSAEPTSRCSRATATGSPQPLRRSRRSGAGRSHSPSTLPTPIASSARPRASSSSSARSTSGSTMRWRPFSRPFTRRRRRSSRGPPGHLPRRGVRHDGRARPHAPAQSRHDRPGRLGALLPGDPAAVGLLRRQVRDPRLHRLVAHRAAARAQQGLDHDGAAAGGQHATVQLVPDAHAGPSPARAADLSARDPCRGRLLGRPPPPSRAVGRPEHRQGDPRELPRAPLADRYLARTGYDAQQMADLPVAPDRPANLFAPVPRVASTHGTLRRPVAVAQPRTVAEHAPARVARRRRRSRRSARRLAVRRR